MTRKIINVFIASPSDLSNERQKLRNIVERINKVFGKRRDIQIELFGWEDTLPSFKRPQEQINKDVEICDLFIGVLWKRWGTDSGKFSSGFEEEFNLARDRKIVGEPLDVWLLFKSVDNDLLQDPGEQLKKVLEFKKNQIDSKELLFKEFKSTEEFNSTIHDDLTAFLLENEQEEEDEEKKLSLKPTDMSKPEDILIDTGKAEQNLELASVYQNILENISVGTESEITFWTSLRTLVSALSLFSLKDTGELLGTHKFHYVYIKRKEWTLSLYERILLIRSFLGDKDGYASGWYWLQNNMKIDIFTILENMAKNDKNEDVQVGAINILMNMNYTPSYDFISELFNSDSTNKLVASISLSNKCTDTKILDLLKSLFESPVDKVRQHAIHSYIDNIYISDPEESFKLFSKKSLELTTLYKQILKENNLNIDTSLLVSTGLNASKHVRLFSASILEKTNELTKEVAQTLLEDSDSHIRKIGFSWMLNNGFEFSLVEVSKLFPKPKSNNSLFNISTDVTENDVIPIILGQKSFDELVSMIDFYSLDGQRVYSVLSSKFSNRMLTRFRSDLDDSFEKTKKDSEEKIYEQYGDKSIGMIKSYKEDLLTFIENEFISSALRGILNDNQPLDLVYARKYIKILKFPKDIMPAVEIIAKYGDETDIDTLLEICNVVYATDKERVIEIILELSQSKETLLIKLAKDDDTKIAEISLKHIDILTRPKKLVLLKELLLSDNDNIRKISAVRLTKLIGKAKLEEFLDEYIGLGRYFYDVVKIFDEFVYSTELLTNPSTEQ